MSKVMIKLHIALFAVFVSIGFGYGQSHDMDLIDAGDQAMERGRYTDAVFYYIQVSNTALTDQMNTGSSSQEAAYYPYSLRTQNRSSAQEEKPKRKRKRASVDNMESLVIHKLAKAYRLAKDYTHAEKWYAKAVEHPNSSFPNAAYHYGSALIYNGKYDEAKTVFEDLIEKRDNKKDPIIQLAQKKLKSCNYGLQNGLDEKTPTVNLMEGEINSGFSSFGMMYYNEGLIYASAKESEPYNSDIYLIKKDEGGSLSEPEIFDEEANSSLVEGAAVITDDGNTMFFTRVDSLDPDQVDIFILRKFNGNWLKPFKLGKNVNGEGYKSMMPCIGGDGKTLYFASNRPGGYGGMDIWKTKINDMGKAKEPVNLGKNVNSNEDEITPFYHRGSKTLYFSTTGRTGFGGYDIFKSTYNILTDTWNTATNLGASVNSSMDDTYFIWGEDMKNGYLTSDKESCSSCDSSQIINIHCNKIYEVNNPSFKIEIEGYVRDIDTDGPISNVTVDFKDIKGELETVTVTTDEDGFYKAELLENREYFIKSVTKGYFADAKIKSTMGMVRPRSILSNFYLEEIPTNEVEIEGIEYDFDSDQIRASSRAVLNELVELLRLNNSLEVEIRSHTDSRGDPAYNIDLSQRRAQSVVEYLVDHGIKRSRLIAKGKGSSEPAVVKVNGRKVKLDDQFIMSQNDKKTKEKYYQSNRRTAFKVLNQ